MNKKKDTSFTYIFRLIQNINYPAPRVKGRKKNNDERNQDQGNPQQDPRNFRTQSL